MPTARSESAKPHSKIIEGERRVGVFHTPYNTNVFPTNDVKAKGIFTTQLSTKILRMALVIFCPSIDCRLFERELLMDVSDMPEAFVW